MKQNLMAQMHEAGSSLNDACSPRGPSRSSDIPHPLHLPSATSKEIQMERNSYSGSEDHLPLLERTNPVGDVSLKSVQDIRYRALQVPFSDRFKHTKSPPRQSHRSPRLRVPPSRIIYATRRQSHNHRPYFCSKFLYSGELQHTTSTKRETRVDPQVRCMETSCKH